LRAFRYPWTQFNSVCTSSQSHTSQLPLASSNSSRLQSNKSRLVNNSYASSPRAFPSCSSPSTMSTRPGGGRRPQQPPRPLTSYPSMSSSLSLIPMGSRWFNSDYLDGINSLLSRCALVLAVDEQLVGKHLALRTKAIVVQFPQANLHQR
jgi:hypothetical protein